MIALAVSPPRIVVAAGEVREVQVTNRGSADASVAVTTAGYTMSLHGRPGIAPYGPRITVRPRALAIPAGATATIHVSASAADPGERPALVLLTSRPRGAMVGIAVRVGVLVVVRGSGRLVHRLVPLALRRDGRVLELVVRNDGNVVESVAPRVDLLRRERVVARLRAGSRDVLPHTRAIFRFAVHVHGTVTARAGGRRVRLRFD